MADAAQPLRALTIGALRDLSIALLATLSMQQGSAQDAPAKNPEPAPGLSVAPPDAAGSLVATREQVSLDEKEYGPGAMELVTPLLNLATAQRRMHDDSGAEQSYRRALGIVEAHKGADSHELVAALAGLGAIYSENGDYGVSLDMLNRAIDVSRKADGLLNPQQLDLMDALIRNYLALGDYDSVTREQQFAMRVAVSAYRKDIPRLVNEIERNAGWFEQMGRYSTARDLQVRGLGIASDLGKEKNLLMVVPLRGIARAHRLEYLYGPEFIVNDASGSSSYSAPNREGEAALEFVIKILETRGGSAADLAQARLDLADWHMLAGDTDKALQAYREAWTAMNVPGAGGTTAFDVPVQIFYRPPGVAHRPPDADRYVERVAEIEFTVAADGRVRGPTLVTDVPEKSAKLVLRAIREARYRPRFVAGAAVETAGMRYRETLYLPGG
jgi:tetratricopeptide (TPR) repeat protein